MKKEEKQKEIRRLNNDYFADKRNGGLHKTVQKIGATELNLGGSVIAEAITLYPGQVYGQIDYVYDKLQILAAIGKRRLIGETTLQNYRERTKSWFRRMARLNMRLTSIMDITPRQVRIVFDDMEKEGLAGGYLQNMNTTMRRFGLWIGKQDLCPPMRYMFADKEVYTRKLSATERKDWGDDNELIEGIIDDVKQECEVSACVLALAWCFGLRVNESIQLRPHESIRGSWLDVRRGTKGGKPRMIPIETQDQREVLAWALEIASRDKQGVMRHKTGITLNQSKSHFRYVMRKKDLTRKGHGKTPHGLRHQFTNDQYQFKTKHASPVRGGGQVDPEVLVGAQKELSEMLGHSRTSITSAYTGNHRHMTRVAKSNVEKLIKKLECDEKLKEFARQLGAERIFVCGGHADGDFVKSDAQVCLSVEMGGKSIPDDLGVQMSERAQQILGCKLVLLVKNDSLNVHVSRLELMGLAVGEATSAEKPGELK